MPLMACPQCGQNVSSLASVCPSCSYSLREQRLKENQLGPQIECRKCGQLISATANVCPHCGVDHPKRTFNLMYLAIPAAALVVVFLFYLAFSGNDDSAPEPSTPPIQAAEQTPSPAADARPTVEETEQTQEPEPIARATPIVVETPPVQPAPSDTSIGPRTRWTADWVNVRSEPRPNSQVVQVLDPGLRVEVGTFNEGFWEVFLDGQLLGYVANSLLLREPPES